MTRAALAFVVLVLAGCGTVTPTPTTKTPKLPAALAGSWAQRANDVAAALAAGDGCTARARATELQQQVITAVNAGRVPRRYQESLLSGVNGLASRITCTPPPAVVHPHPRPHPGKPKHPHPPKEPKPPKPHGHGKGPKKH